MSKIMDEVMDESSSPSYSVFISYPNSNVPVPKEPPHSVCAIPDDTSFAGRGYSIRASEGADLDATAARRLGYADRLKAKIRKMYTPRKSKALKEYDRIQRAQAEALPVCDEPSDAGVQGDLAMVAAYALHDRDSISKDSVDAWSGINLHPLKKSVLLRDSLSAFYGSDFGAPVDLSLAGVPVSRGPRVVRGDGTSGTDIHYGDDALCMLAKERSVIYDMGVGKHSNRMEVLLDGGGLADYSVVRQSVLKDMQGV
jgi:hypothetical protein